MVVMFRGGSAAIHHGSYATTLLFVVGGAVGLAGWNRVGSALLVLHVVTFAGVWLLPRAGIPVPAWNPEAAFLFVAATLASAGLCGKWLSDAEPSLGVP